MRIAINTLVFDLLGAVDFEVVQPFESDETRRRVTRVPTLDGSAAINDYGYSEADRTISFKWATVSAAHTAQVERLFRLYANVRVCRGVDVFTTVPQVFKPGVAECSATFLVLNKSAEYVTPPAPTPVVPDGPDPALPPDPSPGGAVGSFTSLTVINAGVITNTPDGTYNYKNPGITNGGGRGGAVALVISGGVVTSATRVAGRGNGGYYYSVGDQFVADPTGNSQSSHPNRADMTTYPILQVAAISTADALPASDMWAPGGVAPKVEGSYTAPTATQTAWVPATNVQTGGATGVMLKLTMSNGALLNTVSGINAANPNARRAAATSYEPGDELALDLSIFGVTNVTTAPVWRVRYLNPPFLYDAFPGFGGYVNRVSCTVLGTMSGVPDDLYTSVAEVSNSGSGSGALWAVRTIGNAVNGANAVGIFGFNFGNANYAAGDTIVLNLAAAVPGGASVSVNPTIVVTYCEIDED
jgi:hypothetical protein